MSRSDRLAQAKAIGEDVETLVIGAVEGLQAAVDPGDWFDAVVETTVGPRTTDLVTFSSIPVLEREKRVEIKACKRRVSNGDRGDRPGRWAFQIDQHERLIAAGAVYLLAVYEEVVGTKQLVDMLAVPASILDEVLVDRWYDVDRHEGAVAQVDWPQVIGREVADAN
jgi:hypothetical protein